jgi:hypothetical protein
LSVKCLRPTLREPGPNRELAPVNVRDFHPRLARPSGATRVNEPTKNQPLVARLSPEVAALLRHSIERWVSGDAPDDDSALGEALQAAARDARDKGIHAEALVVTLKTTWFEVGGGPSVTHTTASGQRRLDELVTACIKAYYG